MITPKNAEDVMVENTCLRKLEAVSGVPFNAQSIDEAGNSSIRSALFFDRSKSRREDPAAKPLAPACSQKKVTHHEDQLDTTPAFSMFPHKRLTGAASRPHREDACNEIGFPQRGRSCPSKGPPS